MKKVILLIALFLTGQLVLAQSNKPYTAKSFTQPVHSIEVSNAGSIELSGGFENTQVRVYINAMNLKANLSQSDIEKRLSNYKLEINNHNGVLICKASPKPGVRVNLRNGLSFRFVIETSENVDVNLLSSGGSIQLKQLNGNHKFRTSGGSITLNDMEGNIDGSTAGGSIRLNSGIGNIRLRTSGGSINVKNSEGNLEVTTAGGSLTLADLKGQVNARTSGGSIKAHHVNGDIKLTTAGGSIGLKDIKGNLNATTSGGSIKGNIISIQDHLSLKTSAGSVRINLPLGDGLNLDLAGNRIVSAKLEKVSDQLKSGRLKGKINGGGKEVTIRTSAGTIYVD